MTQLLSHTAIVVILALAGCGLGASASAGEPKTPDLPIKLGKVPKLTLTPRPPITVEQAKRIKELIANLAALDSPDYGLSATLSGSSFAPVSGQHHASMLLLTKHNIKPSETLKALVTLGPDALPFLLDALD